MSFSLQSLAHDTRSNVPTSALLDHFKAATVGATTSVIGNANYSNNNDDNNNSNNNGYGGGSEHLHLDDKYVHRSSGVQLHSQMKAKTANVGSNGAWKSERVAPGCVIDLDYDDGCDEEKDAHHARDNDGYNIGCAGGGLYYQCHDEDSLSRPDVCSNRHASSSSPGLRSTVPSSSSTTLHTSNQSNGHKNDDINITEKHCHPLLSIPSGLSAISSMTRTLRLWVKTWSTGENNPDIISSTHDSRTDVRHSMSKVDKVLFPPSDEQCDVLISYGVQLLVEQKPDFAVAYVRTLARLVYNMRSLLTATPADSYPISDACNGVHLDESQRWSGEERGSEGVTNEMTSLLWQAVRQWELAAYRVEKAVQSKAEQLYGAILIVSTSHS